MVTVDDVKNIETLPDSELFARLAEAELAGRLGAAEEDGSNREAIGRRIFESRLSEIREAVCAPSVRAQLEGERFDDNIAYATLIDVLMTVFTGIGLTVAVLLVARMGVKKICAC